MNQKTKETIDMKYRRENPFEDLLVEIDSCKGHNRMCSWGNIKYELWFMGQQLGEAERDWQSFGRGWDVLEINWS